MSLNLLTNSLGASYTNDSELELDSSSGKTCSYMGIFFECTSAETAFKKFREFKMQEISIADTSITSKGHEVIFEGNSYFSSLLTSFDNLPTEIEVALLNLIIWSDHPPIFDETKNYMIHEANLPLECEKIIESSLCHSELTIFSKNSNSKYNNQLFDWLSKDKIRKLLISAHPYFEGKFGFLEMYRALEVGHLSSVRKAFNDKILTDAKSAIKTAEKSVSSDKNMLATFTKETGSESFFKKIFSEVEMLGKTGNSFANELMKKANADVSNKPSLINQQCWQGTTIVYQIRCSIAHAGATGIVVEDFTDSKEVFLKVNPILESLIANILGFNFK